MSEKVEYVEVTVRLPKPVVDFIKKWIELVGDDLNDFLEMAVVSEVKCMLTSEEVFQTPWSETEKAIKANKLEKMLDC